MERKHVMRANIKAIQHHHHGKSSAIKAKRDALIKEKSKNKSEEFMN